MSLFNRNKKPDVAGSNTILAEMALNSIHDGVIITSKDGLVKFINPAAVSMTECGMASNAMGLDYGLLLKLKTKEGRDLTEGENPLVQAMRTSQPLEKYDCCLIGTQSAKAIPVAISVIIPDGAGDRIITFRNIAKELAEEGEQAEFISTASHEMRTPVATIDGYISLTLNPQTASIDERARGYLTAAQAASKHLGKLFQDLLDVTKLDDGRIRPKMVPVEMVGTVKQISDAHAMRASEAKIDYRFGTSDPANFGDLHHINQVVYGFVDIDFLREIMDNLIDNAIKYTPAGGSIYINVRGDGDRVLINVTDTGIGISSEDIGHIFQKFYRADNSDTREIGGTGLGLYLVKQRVEAMGGRVWAESGFGEGSTFFVSLPRLSNEEYEKRMIVVRNQQALMAQSPPPRPQAQPQPQPQPVTPQPQPQPVTQPQPAQPAQQQINNQIGGQQ